MAASLRCAKLGTAQPQLVMNIMYNVGYYINILSSAKFESDCFNTNSNPENFAQFEIFQIFCHSGLVMKKEATPILELLC